MWVLVGDFNNFKARAEKKSVLPYPNYLIEGFNSCLQDVNLHDLDITGHQFTWERGRNTNHWIEIRLDRVLGNPQWLSMFDMAKVYNIEVHHLIIVLYYCVRNCRRKVEQRGILGLKMLG